MKVLFQGKLDLLKSFGGDRIQIENTADQLQKLGVRVDIVPNTNIDCSKYDLVHLFQLDWIPETILYVNNAKKYNKKIVLSPIHHSVESVTKFENEYTFDFRRISKVLFKDQFKRDTLKNVYRSFFDFSKAYPTYYTIKHGFKNCQKESIKQSEVLLVQTELEAKYLKKTFNIDFKHYKVPNGVPEIFLNVDQNKLPNLVNFENYILCVGRIEARKNQLNIIKAVDLLRNKLNKDFQLVFVGTANKKSNFEYVTRFNFQAKKHTWITHLKQIPHQKMPSVFSHAKVCVSASWFETTGLTSLESVFCHTNSVASGEPAKEYLGEFATYCEPWDVNSIASAIEKEYFAPRPKISIDKQKEYTWENTAKKTLAVYNKILQN